MNAIIVMQGGLRGILNIEVNYYTRTEFIRKLYEAVLEEKYKPPQFLRPLRMGPTLIPSEARVVSLEEDV